MRTRILSILIFSMSSAVFGQATATKHVATTPVDRMEQAWWKARHEKCTAMTQAGNLDLVFIGDSITQGWEGRGKSVWEKFYGSRKAGNFGFSGDRTEHVLWRLDNGEITGLSPAPKVFVIMIGTNNIGHRSATPEQTAEGVEEIVTTLRERFPSTKILLLAIFPRGANNEDIMRKQVVATNAGFKDIADGKMIHFLDIGNHFIQNDGTLPKTVMPDLLHLNTDGYGLWANAIEPTLKGLLGE